MENFTQVTIFGKDHGVQGEIYSEALEPFGIALATSAGVTSKPNEDAIGASVLNDEICLAIADGHWGKAASEMAISKTVERFRSGHGTESEIRSDLFSLFEEINTQLYELAVSSSAAAIAETTLIVCLIRKTQTGISLHWSSFGDSYIFLLRDRQFKQLNTLSPRWLGYYSKLSENADARPQLMRLSTNETRFVGVSDGLETGIDELLPGDVVFLCTDGLVSSDRSPAQWILDEMEGILNSELSVGDRVEKLVAFALARGEKDNISCVSADI